MSQIVNHTDAYPRSYEHGDSQELLDGAADMSVEDFVKEDEEAYV